MDPATARLPILMLVWLCAFGLAACSDPPGPTLDDDPTPDPVPEVDENNDNNQIECLFGELEGVGCLPEPPRATPMDQCPSGELNEDGVCLPEPPRGTPEDQCPSGAFTEGGICKPEAPQIEAWACPEGWQALTLAEVGGQGCEPPAMPALPCPEGSMPVLGVSECVPVAPGCPEEGEKWHGEAELRARAPGYEGRIIYADAGGAFGGVGTREGPVESFQRAVLVAEAGDIVALAPGDYSEAVVVDRDVAILGACAALTRLSADTPSPGTPAVWFAAGGQLSGLRIGGVRRGIQIQTAGTQTLIEGVIVQNTVETGILVAGEAEVRVRDTLVVDTQPDGDGRFGIGLSIQSGSSVTAERLSIVGSHHFGILTTQSSVLEAVDLIIEGTQPRASDGSGGQNLYVTAGGQVTLSRALIGRGHSEGVLAAQEEASLSFEDVVIEETQARASDGDRGMGMIILDTAQVDLNRVLVRRNRGIGVLVGDVNTRLRATDVSVFETRSYENNQRMGEGLHMQGGAEAILLRAAFVGNRVAGMAVFGGARVEMEDVLIAHTGPQEANDQGGQGIIVGEAASMRGLRVRLHENTSTGVLARLEGTVVELDDISITDTQPQPFDGHFGRGIEANEGAELLMTRVEISGSHDTGGQISGVGSALHMTDGVIRGTRPRQSDNLGGQGLKVQLGALVTLFRVSIEDNRDMGLTALTPDTRVELIDVTIAGTNPRAADMAAGHGLNIQKGATGRAERTLIVGNRVANISVFDEGSALELVDVIARDGQSDTRVGDFGLGLFVVGQSALTAVRLLVDNNRDTGLLVLGDTRATLSDLIIQDTSANEINGSFGFGLGAGRGALITLLRGSILRNHSVGVLLNEAGTSLLATDLSVRDTLSQPMDLQFGRGMELNLGADATLTRARFDNNRQAGIIVHTPDTTLSVEQVLITRTQPARCIEQGCPEHASGSGLIVLEEARVEIEHFVVDDNALIGVQIARNADISAGDGVITANRIGVNIQVPDLDLEASFKDVRLIDNGQDLDASELDTPEAAGALKSVEEIVEEASP